MQNSFEHWTSSIIFLGLLIISSTFAADKLPLQLIKLPQRFHISVFAPDIIDARSMTLGKKNTVFVGSKDAGKVYAIVPNSELTHARWVFTIASDLNMPNGVAFYKGDLYVAEMSRILKFPNIEEHLANPPKPIVITDSLPNKTHHGWRYIKFGPDGWLYVAIGAPCNVCLSDEPIFATIIRMKPDGSDQQIYAKGIRNSVGFAWDPSTHDFWFTNNGRDWMGDNQPPDQLNHAPKPGLDFGFPYYHAKNIPDPIYGRSRSTQGITFPTFELGPHVAALGMIFYNGKMFPPQYHQIFIAEHGSWNRSKKIGYRVMMVRLNNQTPIAYQPFATGWLQGQKAWGRPVDLLQMPDGALLISDDYAHVIYRVAYQSQ